MLWKNNIVNIIYWGLKAVKCTQLLSIQIDEFHTHTRTCTHTRALLQVTIIQTFITRDELWLMNFIKMGSYSMCSIVSSSFYSTLCLEILIHTVSCNSNLFFHWCTIFLGKNGPQLNKFGRHWEHDCMSWKSFPMCASSLSDLIKGAVERNLFLGVYLPSTPHGLFI